jgi:hypothetical protein
MYPAMLLRPEYLSQKLDCPLPTKDGGTLRTIGEACDYMTGMGKKRELRQHWQRVAKLVLAKAERVVAGGREHKVARVSITAAGRRALAEMR